VYSLASVAVVGGSFGGGIGGHNPIEPAAQGVPVVFGPDVRNFPEVCDVLVNAQAAVQVRDGDGLRRTLSALMADATRREQMGAHALETVTRNRVTLDRTVDLVLGVVDSAAA
jgi:3-deoxy-D-manno-octulosonic-acid transferase